MEQIIRQGDRIRVNGTTREGLVGLQDTDALSGQTVWMVTLDGDDWERPMTADRLTVIG